MHFYIQISMILDSYFHKWLILEYFEIYIWWKIKPIMKNNQHSKFREIKNIYDLGKFSVHGKAVLFRQSYRYRNYPNFSLI